MTNSAQISAIGGEPSVAIASNTSYVTETPSQSDRLVDSIGVDSHFTYTGSTYDTQWPAVSKTLIASGIRHLRDGTASLGNFGAHYTTLGQAGIFHSIGFGLDASADSVTQALAAQAPYVDFVETPNEMDLTAASAPQWATQLDVAQGVLYNAVRSSSQFSTVSVLGPSMGNNANFVQLGNLDATSDYGNVHLYGCNENPGTADGYSVQSALAFAHASTSKPIWFTETGYNDNPLDRCSISDALIAKYDPRLIAENFNDGVKRTYFYEYADDGIDPSGITMGFVDTEGRPKAQYRSLASLIAALNDRGPSFAPTPFAYSLTGATQNVHHLLLQKRDGTYILMLWLEVPAWQAPPGNVGGSMAFIPSQTVTLSTARTYATATQLSYDASWNLIPSSLSIGAKNYSISVSDSITLVELH